MAFTIHQWPANIQRKEIEGLPSQAATAVLVMLRAMSTAGPQPEEYATKQLGKRLRGLIQANMRINKEQIRVLYAVFGNKIFVLHVFKKTSQQIEDRGYERAIGRKKTVEIMLAGGDDEFPAVN